MSLKLQFLLYLESWPDSSLENLVLVYTGQGKDVDLKKFPDKKMKDFFELIEKLKASHKHTDLQTIYDTISEVTQSILESRQEKEKEKKHEG